jgi:UDP-glucose 4-epimerase
MMMQTHTDSPPKHALVTGGAGFIGSHLTRALLDRGLDVTVLDNLSVGSASAVPQAAQLVQGDIRTPDDVHRALQDVDCVFHLAAQVTIRASFEKFYEDVDTNLMGTLNVLRCLDRQKIRQFTLASSMAVYADAAEPKPIDENHPTKPISPYGMSKLAAENIGAHVLQQTPVRFSAVRYFNTFGPGQTYTPYVGVVTIFATRLFRGENLVIYGDGDQARDFVHVDDVVAGTVATLDGPPGVYNLGTGNPTTVNQVAQLLINKINRAASVETAPPQSGELRYSVADIGRASQQLGYAPQRRLDDALDPVLQSIRDRLH